jgi:hypothetical protein
MKKLVEFATNMEYTKQDKGLGFKSYLQSMIKIIGLAR